MPSTKTLLRSGVHCSSCATSMCVSSEASGLAVVHVPRWCRLRPSCRARRTPFLVRSSTCGEKAMPAEETRANFRGKVFGVEAQVVC